MSFSNNKSNISSTLMKSNKGDEFRAYASNSLFVAAQLQSRPLKQYGFKSVPDEVHREISLLPSDLPTRPNTPSEDDQPRPQAFGFGNSGHNPFNMTLSSQSQHAQKHYSPGNSGWSMLDLSDEIRTSQQKQKLEEQGQPMSCDSSFVLPTYNKEENSFMDVDVLPGQQQNQSQFQSMYTPSQDFTHSTFSQPHEASVEPVIMMLNSLEPQPSFWKAIEMDVRAFPRPNLRAGLVFPTKRDASANTPLGGSGNVYTSQGTRLNKPDITKASASKNERWRRLFQCTSKCRINVFT
ncbi:hypothetical protein LENED_010981 [Lentinula edodes]|uniref:Uncharacterized protein n=1 Tax=Lentinula edodes TaxID=5353 RepID=A0A1Q3ENT8_LENED|nr:hypothetical protein LENED_010981 [Lentinula edodes]